MASYVTRIDNGESSLSPLCIITKLKFTGMVGNIVILHTLYGTLKIIHRYLK